MEESVGDQVGEASEEKEDGDSLEKTGDKDIEVVAAPVSRRDEYTKKLKDIEKGLADLEAIIANGTQVEMNEAQAKILKRWDDALNEIYGVLEEQLSTKEVSSLREEQREWIKQRDKVAEEEALKYEGGSLAPFEYLSTKARMTKERCYELVEGYMK